MSGDSDSPLSLHAPDSIIARGQAGPITAARFYGDVSRLAEKLPHGQFIINTCRDRYLFMVGLGACLVSGRTTLMPSSFTANTVQQLQARYADLVCLHDGHQRAQGVADVQLMPTESVISDPMAPRIPDDQIAAIVFTSGSTGEPTAHIKRWGRLRANGAAEAARLDCEGLTIVATVPAQHMYGFESSVLLALHGGASVWRDRPFYPADIRAALQAVPERRMLVTTPYHLSALLQAALAIPSCEKLLSATAPLSLELAEQAEEAFECPLFEIYGCTESGQVASRRTTQGSAWQLLPGLRMEQDAQGTSVFDGHVEGRVYLSDHIQDVADGRFQLGERHADMVNIAGKRASLAALNSHLRSMPGVKDACYVRPHAETRNGVTGVHRLAALVVAPDVDTTDILKALRAHVDAPFLPRPLLKVQSLPRNATGKILAADLDALFQAALAAGGSNGK